MPRNLKTRAAIVLLVLAASIWYLYPPKRSISLGLDLQGGIHLVLGVETDKHVAGQTDRAAEDFKAALDRRGVAVKNVAREGLRAFTVELASPQSWNDALGIFCSLFVVTPYYQWRHDHAVHHATAGDLDRRGIGDINTLTVREYQALTPWRRFLYRMYRNPIIMFGIGPTLLFVVQHRLPFSMLRGADWRRRGRWPCRRSPGPTGPGRQHGPASAGRTRTRRHASPGWCWIRRG